MLGTMLFCTVDIRTALLMRSSSKCKPFLLRIIRFLVDFQSLPSFSGAPASATSVTGTDMKASTSARADSESANRPMSSGTPTQKVHLTSLSFLS